MQFSNSFKLITRLLSNKILYRKVETTFSTLKVLHKTYNNMGSVSMEIVNGILNGGEKNWFQHEDTIHKNVIVICGPSGSGKSTLLKILMNEYPDCFGFSISHTTRNPREGEVPGKDYYFVSRGEMLEAVRKGEFVEHTEFSGNIYGTSKKAVNSVIQRGRICILDIEIEGVKNIKNTDFDAKYIFIKPPSIQVLEDRLRGRGTETEESIQKRLARAKTELAYGETPGNFDIVLVNDNATETYQELKKFLKKDIEDLRKKRYQK